MNGITLSDGTTITANGQLAGTPSQLFDAVAVILSADATAMLVKEAAAVQWVMDAFGHLKAIGYNKEAQPLLDKAGIVKMRAQQIWVNSLLLLPPNAIGNGSLPCAHLHRL